MTASQTTESSVLVTAEREDGERTAHELHPGRNVLVGTSKDCGLRLEGPRLSPCHCLLSLEDGTLWVQDWASTSGTLLNGEPIEAKSTVGAGDQLSVGEYRLSVTEVSASPFGGRHGGEEQLPEEVDPTQEAAPTGIDSCDPPSVAAFWGEEERSGEGDAFEMDSFEQETIALLREEIDALQGMLAQRDAQLAELSGPAESSGANSDVENGGENSEALFARMEQLLEEAACGDERVELLEGMLRAAEEANQAEQEERHQLEAWVGDIERRIIQRDDQRDAEIETLRRRLAEAHEERDRAQLQLKQAASTGNAPKHYEESLDRLQHQNKSLQEKLASVTVEQEKLIKRLASTASQHDEATREERAALAQERAIASRLRSELTNKLAELEDSTKPAKPAATEAATRLQALREHLREIHIEEQQEHQTPSESTLTGRIARLWKRIEN